MMMHRKDLLYAGLTGAVLSTLACLALMPRDKAQPVPTQEAGSRIRDEKRQDTPLLPPVITQNLRADKTSLSNHAHSSPVVATHPAKTVKIVRTPRAVPKSVQPVAGASSPRSAPQEATVAPPALVPQNPDGAGGARVITPQEARAALGKVGTDPEAEAVWISAINDPNMPANQRKDLIEDLNEEGFANSKQLTAADLPRIENRLALIEELAPEAIDQTNADAFQEAYKDLKNMHSRLSKP